MPLKLYTAFLVSITLLFGAPAHAEIFKWVDANGITHYSDKAPKKQPSRSLNYGAKKKKKASLNKPANRSVKKKQLKKSQRPVKPKATRSPRKTVAPKKAIKALKQKLKVRKQAKKNVVYDLELIGKKPLPRKVVPAALPEAVEEIKPQMTLEQKPDLDADEYHVETEKKVMFRKPVRNVKQKLCNENRMLLAALQEKGFNGYQDEEGHYRLAWGGDGIYQGKRLYLTPQQIIKKTSDIRYNVGQYCDDPYNQTLQDEARADWIRAEYCTVSKAVLEDLEHPFMRSTDSDILKQTEEVQRLCAELQPGQYQDDDRYYPKALRTKVVLPRHLTRVEEESPKKILKSPEETLEQLLALIE